MSALRWKALQSRVSARLGPLGQLHGPAEVALFARVVAFAATVPLVTRLSLPRQAAVLSWRPPRPRWLRRPGGPDPGLLAGCVELAQRVASPVVRRGCLTRGITLYWFLTRANDDIALCFGVGRPEGEFVGHCWLTRHGQPFLERVDPTSFEVIFRIPPG